MKKNIAMTVGVFDCLHEGHINLLRNLKEAGERVVVFLHDDLSTFQNKGRFTVQPYTQRCANLLACGLVNKVVKVANADPSEVIDKTICRFFLDDSIIYIRADDWRDFPGRVRIEAMGIEIRYIEYTKGVSTTEIRKELQKRPEKQ